ncbi:hypothetical protein K7X08_003648 [Anisodus acutangulus]|uniref:Uncharacterized protein n=1 Tax=Anisodus acutangulus TaxID=402998 RepID=A0A9Q1RJL4_9SOLA|nr:hypothetical protein K7X08_003648 [Anisodus acutangulus]
MRAGDSASSLGGGSVGGAGDSIWCNRRGVWDREQGAGLGGSLAAGGSDDTVEDINGVVDREQLAGVSSGVGRVGCCWKGCLVKGDVTGDDDFASSNVIAQWLGQGPRGQSTKAAGTGPLQSGTGMQVRPSSAGWATAAAGWTTAAAGSRIIVVQCLGMFVVQPTGCVGPFHDHCLCCCDLCCHDLRHWPATPAGHAVVAGCCWPQVLLSRQRLTSFDYVPLV